MSDTPLRCPNGHEGPFEYVTSITNFHLVAVDGNRVIVGPIDSQDEHPDPDVLECQAFTETPEGPGVCLVRFEIPKGFVLVDDDAEYERATDVHGGTDPDGP